MKIRLIFASGQLVGQKFEVDQDVTIGRSPSSDLQIEDTALSTLHCKLVLHEGHVFLEDLDSTNGTEVNGKTSNKSNFTTATP